MKKYIFFSLWVSAVCFSTLSAFNAEFIKDNPKKPVGMKNSEPAEITDTAIIKAGEKPVLVADQFSFTEGPASDKAGNVFFTDQPNNRIWKYGTDGHLSLFMENAGRSNGMFFDAKGNLISCADEQNQLWEISPRQEVKVLLKDFNGQRFNGPNDVWVHPVSGHIYFTDPLYKRDYWKGERVHMKEERVYHLSKNKKRIEWVAEDLVKPNGIVGTPDGKFLYVADIGAGKTYKYPVKKNGQLGEKQLFAKQGSDGMTIDNQGNIYLTGDGVTVYNSHGQKIAHIPIPENWTSNVCFAGKDRTTLFITASRSVYIMKMNVKGVN